MPITSILQNAKPERPRARAASSPTGCRPTELPTSPTPHHRAAPLRSPRRRPISPAGATATSSSDPLHSVVLGRRGLGQGGQHVIPHQGRHDAIDLLGLALRLHGPDTSGVIPPHRHVLDVPPQDAVPVVYDPLRLHESL